MNKNEMTPLDDLLERLNAAGPDGWEDEYARHGVELTRDEAFAIVASERACAEWFAFRFDAGPPGVPLPPMEQAIDAVLDGHDGTPLDAYRVVFSPRPLPEDIPENLILAVLCNSAACALKRGTIWFGAWLAARAGLVAVALGAPERAWILLHALTIDGQRHPLLDQLAIFEPIRDNPTLERNPWIRAAICRLWPTLGVPLVPRLPVPPVPEAKDTTIEVTLDELSRVGADRVRALVESMANAMAQAKVDAHADHPLVRDLRARAMEPGSPAPDPGELPPWFEDWARAVARTGEVHLARLAGLVLHHAGTSDPRLVAGLVLPALRASDLSVLSTSVNLPELQSFLDELAAAAGALPETVGDALVAAALPGHVDQGKSFPVLVQDIELLADLEKKPGGIVERISAQIQRATQDLAQEHVEARPRVEQFLVAVRRAAARLGDARLLVAQDVERAAQALDVPGLTTGFLELAVEAKGLEPLERLLLALALRRAVTGTEHATHWRTRLIEMASDTIYVQRALGLFALRLMLLDELIAIPDPGVSRAEAHYQRANTRRAHSPSDPREMDLVLVDLHAAMRLARAEGNPDLHALATAMWAKTLAWLEADGARHQRGSMDEATRAIEQALELPLKPFHQAVLFQARAHLLRANDPQEAARALEQAQALVVEEDPQFWVELAAELVTTLVRARHVERAVACGMAAIERASCATQHTSLGMLHIGVGEALVASQRHVEARRQLEAGLALVRGHDPYNEPIARDRLARLGLATGDRELAEEHLRHLRDRRDALDIATRRDLSYLEAAAAQKWGNDDAQRSAWHAVLSFTRDDAERAGIRLELARVDLAAGRAVEQLDALVAQAVNLLADATRDALVTDLVCSYDAPLSPTTREAVVHWAMRRRRPSVAARVHHRAGRVEDARTLLREAVAGELDGDERLACIHILIAMLGADAREERRQLCAELERLLEEVRDVAHVRLDLAEALRVDADGAPDVLWRARRHAQRGLEGVEDDQAVAHGYRTLGRIVVDLVGALLPESSEVQAELASWFLGERAASMQDLAQLRLVTAGRLLLPGPLVHPKVLAVAQHLVALANSGPPNEEEEKVRTLWARLEWIERCVDARTLVSPAPEPTENPCDNLPAWLIGLVLGNSEVGISEEDLGTGVRHIRSALWVRPDAADRVVSSLMPLQHRLKGRARQALLDEVYAVVHSMLAHREHAWPLLRGAINALPKKHRHPMVAVIASAACRSLPPEPHARQQANSRKDGRHQKSAGRLGGRQRALECFAQGTRLMQSLLMNPATQSEVDHFGLQIDESRELLAEAVRIARKRKMPELFDFLVSYGNAWKTPPGEDIDKALRIYESAKKAQAVPEQRAKLWKVYADALRSRGLPDDLRQAEKLLQRSLTVRRGWQRVETLASAALVAYAHPDLDASEREIHSAEHLMDAVRADRRHAGPLLDFLLDRLAAWQRLLPEDLRPERFREELRGIYPERSQGIEASRAQPSPREEDVLRRTLAHPATQAFMKVRLRLRSAAERSSDPYGRRDRLDSSMKAKLEEYLERESLVGHPEKAEMVLSTLDAPQSDTARPGVLTARVALLAYLARLGRRAAQDVKTATREALDELQEVDDPLVRATLLREIASIWSPNDHEDDPVRDFGLAVELLQQCVALEGGETQAIADTLGYLARARRYSPAGDQKANLREARRLYQICLDRARASGDRDEIANCLHNLSEVESQMGEGSRLERLQRSALLIQEAVATARSPYERAKYTANLAWEQTQIGMQLGDAGGKRYLEQALETFGQVDVSLLEDHQRRSLEGNRCVCEGVLARLAGGREAECALWRQRLTALDPATTPYDVATTKHNLANALMFGEDVTPIQFAEGLRLSEEAAAIRTIKENARHHWETALNAGRAYLWALRTHRFDLLPMIPPSAVREARAWLQRACDAARTLGPGEELADTGFALCELALAATSTREAIDLAEEAWSVVREAAAYLLLDTESREREARIARHIGSMLADRLAEDALAVATPGLAFVLQGESAEIIRRWLVRSQEPARRPLRARLSRPRAVSAGLWQSWLSELDQRDQRQVANVLDRIHQAAPDFLVRDEASGATWRWLQARPRSIALAIVLVPPVPLALVMQVDDTGRQRTWVLGLELPRPPLPLEALAEGMRGAVPGADAGAVMERLAGWVRQHAVSPVLRFLGGQPSAVLWSPDPYLRLVAPGAIWRDVPVATAASLFLPGIEAWPARRRSSLVVLADPGARAPELDLHKQGVPALDLLTQAAAARGPVRKVGSVGDHFGRKLLGDEASVRDTPASARDVFAEAAEHDVLVLIAHGEVETPDDAAILCLDASGHLDRLDVAMIGEAPDRFAGAKVLLLACEGGRVGASLVEPGGMAGALLSAGACYVVAPLWHIGLDVAAQVAAAVLQGLAAGEEPWEALAGLQVSMTGEAPHLGGPPPSRAERLAAQELQRLSFVTWVG